MKRKVHQKAFNDLVSIKNNCQKGFKIQYEKLDLAAYLTSMSNISVNDKIEMFAYKSEMNELPYNYGNKTKFDFGCKTQIMNNEHLLNYPQINLNENTRNLTQILNGSNKEKLNMQQKLQENNKIRIENLMDSD